MYNLIEYSDNYLKTFGILWNYCRSKPAVNNGGLNGAFNEAKCYRFVWF